MISIKNRLDKLLGAWVPIICQGDQDKKIILPNVLLAEAKYDGRQSSLHLEFTHLLSHNISLKKEPVARDLGANIQGVGASIVPLAMLLVNVGIDYGLKQTSTISLRMAP